MRASLRPRSAHETGAPAGRCDAAAGGRAPAGEWSALSFAGRVLVGAGLFVVAFAAYHVWATGRVESRSQDRLRREFVAAATTTVPEPAPVVAVAPGAPVVATTVAATPPPPLGQPVAVLRIPRIGVDAVVVEGVGTEQLKQGPGHYEGTPLPGSRGNAAIAGHRTTYGAPFFDLNELAAGDAIFVTTHEQELLYVVTGSVVVAPDEVSVLADRGDDRLTLTTCEPRYSARARLVVSAVLTSAPRATHVR